MTEPATDFRDTVRAFLERTGTAPARLDTADRVLAFMGAAPIGPAFRCKVEAFLRATRITDTQGNMLGALMHTANIQERDGAPDAIAYTKESFPTLAHLFADGGDAGEKLETALQVMDGPTIELVKRPDGAKGFVVIARRWIVGRTFAWLGRCRRLAKDWEATIASSETWLLIASIRRTTKLIARTCKQ